MDPAMIKKLHLVSGRANLPLAQDIAEHLGVGLGQANLSNFANGEIHCRYGESVRGKDVFIVQSHGAVRASPSTTPSWST
jgi:ribose-phosphate pyrophosphokinase